MTINVLKKGTLVLKETQKTLQYVYLISLCCIIIYYIGYLFDYVGDGANRDHILAIMIIWYAPLYALVFGLICLNFIWYKRIIFSVILSVMMFILMGIILEVFLII